MEGRTVPYNEIEDTEGHPIVAMEDARAGETSGRMRIVLITSLALAVIALGVIMLSFAQGT